MLGNAHCNSSEALCVYILKQFFNILNRISLIALFLPALKSGHIKRIFSILVLSLAVHICSAQVIVTPYLRCVIASLTGSTNSLTWDMAANNPCGNFVCYQVYRATTLGGPYSLDTTITDQTAVNWVDHNVATSSSWFYYIKDSFNCAGATYSIADTVQNEPNPQTPLIVNVSVNPDSTITFQWQPSTSQQTRFYIIYIVEPNGTKVAVDTVYGRFNTTWIDSNRLDNPYASSITYTVSAGDSCNGNQLSAYNTSPQQTVLLNYSSARCSPSIPITWTKYVNMTGGLGYYQIYVSRNDSAYVLVDTVDNATLTYNYNNFNNGDSLQIHVVAVGAADTTIKASSNYIRFVASVIKPPAFLYLTELTVDSNNNHVDMRWVVDNNAKMYEYQVYNSEDGALYNTIRDANNGVQQIPVPVARFSSYDDGTVSPQYGPYYYYVQGYDSCQTFANSPPGEIISLQATLSDFYQITLNWNLFRLYGAYPYRYDLYRDYGNGKQLIHTFDSTRTTFIDSLFDPIFQSVSGEFCYIIKATYHLVLPDAHYDTILTTLSNIACVDHRPIIYIPNAFVWNGVNNFFKPKIIFGDPAGYSMTIWDRYGGKIFETHDPNGSWDGTNGGKPVDQGGYAYLIQFTALDGTPVERKGIVMFIKK